MKALAGLVLLGSLFPAPRPAPVVWGGVGHRLVCDMAWRRLTPAAQALVRELRAADPDSGPSFPDSCDWADRVRSTTHTFTNAYHYINVPAGVAGADLDRDCGHAERRCAPWAIQHYSAVMLDRAATPLQRAEALKFIGHFVGDIHQPLHAGRPGDLGGNTIRVDFFGRRTPNGDSLNLHSVWDTGILQHGGITWPDSLPALEAGITAGLAAQWETVNVLVWVQESYRASEDLVYRIPQDRRIEDAYFRSALAHSRTVLQRGAVRLALLLNRIADRTLDPQAMLVAPPETRQ